MSNIRTFQSYIDAAMTHQGFEFEFQLSTKLMVSQSKFCSWKSGRIRVPEQIAIQLAELGGLDPHLAVIDAAIWHAEGKPHYKILVETAEIIQSAA